ncbi:MAG: glycosyltransferase family 4 protein [Acidobacteriota bacterium]
MKVLHLASVNRWTGAAAPAFAETMALREAGIDAHYAYVGGYKLAAKLAPVDFAHPVIDKAQNPRAFVRSVGAIERLLLHHRFDVIHAHLTYDHWLARFAARMVSGAHVARTFHARRVLRSDPFTRSLIARSEAVFIVNSTFRDAPALRDREPVFTPPPLDREQFTPQGPNVRARYGIAPGAPLLAAIGKLAWGRGFEAVLDTFAGVRRTVGGARLMIIGHGGARPALERHAANLGVADAVVWAGYHEDDLADHYRAADVLLFTAAGSDEGHRAVIEAMGCGVIPVTYPLTGMDAILGDLAPRLIAESGTSDSLALKVTTVLGGKTAELQRHAYERSEEFGYERAARRLSDAYFSLF